MNTTSRMKNASRNIVWGVIERIVMTFCPFMIRTMLIHFMGAEYLGLNGLFSSILQVLSLAELGVGSAITYSMYKPIAENDEEKVCAVLGLYRKMYSIIGTVILALGLIIMPWLDKFITGSYPAEINLSLLYLIYLINTVVSYWLFAYKECLLIASQRNDIRNKVTIVLNALMYISQMALLMLFRNYYLYAIVIPICTVVSNFCKAYIVSVNFPNIACKGKLEKCEINEILKRIVALMLSKISGVFRNSFANIILSATLGLVVVAKYQNYFYIVNTLFGFIGVLNSALVPTLGNALATESDEAIWMLYKKFNFVMYWIISWWTVCMIGLFQPFMELWAGKEYLFSFAIAILFAWYFYGLEMGNMVDLFRSAAGMWWEDRFRPIIEAVLTLTLNLICAKLWGVAGILGSTLACVFCINIPWIAWVVFNKLLHKPLKLYILKLVKNIFVTLIISVATIFLCELSDNISNNLVAILLLRAIICCIIPNTLYFCIYYFDNDCKDSIEYVKAIIRRKTHGKITK